MIVSFEMVCLMKKRLFLQRLASVWFRNLQPGVEHSSRPSTKFVVDIEINSKGIQMSMLNSVPDTNVRLSSLQV
jgi:hypothetical protein